MFNMEKVGRKIAELRKNHNMTQLELADKIGISFQAVSNWERGNSMPDISKLPELASLFDVTIDELLGEKSELVESAAKGDIKEYLEHNDISSEEIRKVAPVLRPNQVDAIYESKKINDLQEIAFLLPYLSEDMVDQLAVKAAEEGDSHNLNILKPFVSVDVIGDIARKWMAEGQSIAGLAPFICEDDMCEFVNALYQKSGLDGLTGILPFIYEDQLEQIADDLYQKSGLDSLSSILPFICEDQLEEIAKQEYAINGLWNFELIAPFLNEDCLNTLVQEAIRKDGIKAISHIAPFLDSEMLSEFVREEYLK